MGHPAPCSAALITALNDNVRHRLVHMVVQTVTALIIIGISAIFLHTVSIILVFTPDLEKKVRDVDLVTKKSSLELEANISTVQDLDEDTGHIFIPYIPMLDETTGPTLCTHETCLDVSSIFSLSREPTIQDDELQTIPRPTQSRLSIAVLQTINTLRSF